MLTKFSRAEFFGGWHKIVRSQSLACVVFYETIRDAKRTVIINTFNFIYNTVWMIQRLQLCLWQSLREAFSRYEKPVFIIVSVISLDIHFRSYSFLYDRWYFVSVCIDEFCAYRISTRAFRFVYIFNTSLRLILSWICSYLIFDISKIFFFFFAFLSDLKYWDSYFNEEILHRFEYD